MSSDTREEAIRDAKRYVRDVVQNDWSFEFSAKPGAPPPVYPANPEPTEVLEWRLREFDSSGSELEPQFSPVGSPTSPGDDALSPAGSAGSNSRVNERRRKRRRQMEEEMSWNEGLRTWVERRDAWSGALSKEQIQVWEEARQQAVMGSLGDAELGDTDSTTTVETDIQSMPASATSRSIAVPATGESSNLVTKTDALNIGGKENQHPASAQRGEAQDQDRNDETKPELMTDAIPDIQDLPQPLSSCAAIPATSPATSTTASTPSVSPDPFHDPLIPVVPSLIANTNPIRASITPAMYPSIYSKVVVQGLTPTVPINLADMTKAMVQGWKADGQWPPKPQNLVLTNDAIVRPSNASATKHPDTPAIPVSTGDKDRPSSPESKRKSGLASTVRKVLHFSGFHQHPFHRRGSSSQHLSHGEEHAGAGEGSAAGGNGNSNHEQAEK